MAAEFVEIPALAFEQRLLAAGFEPDLDARGNEVVYRRAHARCKHLSVKIYTTLPQRGAVARECGTDAIRVVAVFEKKPSYEGERHVSFGIFKSRPVHRSGSPKLAPEARIAAVLERTIERAREAYAACNEHCKGDKRCWSCCGKPATHSPKEGN